MKLEELLIGIKNQTVYDILIIENVNMMINIG